MSDGPKTTKAPWPKKGWESWPSETLYLTEKEYRDYYGYYQQDVYLEGNCIGTLHSWVTTPHTRIAGTRLRRDLAPRRVWSNVDSFATKYERRADALEKILEAHLANVQEA